MRRYRDDSDNYYSDNLHDHCGSGINRTRQVEKVKLTGKQKTILKNTFCCGIVVA
jgi:hypothetical protein